MDEKQINIVHEVVLKNKDVEGQPLYLYEENNKVSRWM